MRIALTIAGSDSSGGAGIQADLKTFAALGVYGVSAITSITAQSTKGIEAAMALPADLVTAQIEAVAGDLTINATKVGMLANAAIVEAVAAAIAELDLPLVVLDPVLVSSSGERLLDADGVRALCAELLPRARVVTPNIPEAEALSGIRIKSLDDARNAARRIQEMGAAAVLITGGHRGHTPNAEPRTPNAEPRTTNDERRTPNAEPRTPNAERRTPNAEPRTPNAERRTPNAEPRTPNAERRTTNDERRTTNDDVIDLLFDGQTFHEFRVPRVESRHTHGTGCTFASAVAAGLALGRALPDAAAHAQQYVAGAIAHAPGIGHGRGPVGHFWQHRSGRNPTPPGRWRAAPAPGVPGSGRTPYTETVLPLLFIGREPLDVERIAAAVAASAGADASAGPSAHSGQDGAVVTFLGLVRNHNLGRRVRYLEYDAYEPLALKVFERVAREIGERWPSARLALHHRIGRLEIGEASVAIATRSPHRGDAYAASRYAIERIKQIAPIWKHEFFDGGEVWIEGATANPDDERARAEAERIACA